MCFSFKLHTKRILTFKKQISTWVGLQTFCSLIISSFSQKSIEVKIVVELEIVRAHFSRRQRHVDMNYWQFQMKYLTFQSPCGGSSLDFKFIQLDRIRINIIYNNNLIIDIFLLFLFNFALWYKIHNMYIGIVIKVALD